jgi:hypothetical protein
MQFYSGVFLSASKDAGTERHKMEQSLPRFVTPVELGRCMKKETMRVHEDGGVARNPPLRSTQSTSQQLPACEDDRMSRSAMLKHRRKVLKVGIIPPIPTLRSRITHGPENPVSR